MASPLAVSRRRICSRRDTGGAGSRLWGRAALGGNRFTQAHAISGHRDRAVDFAILVGSTITKPAIRRSVPRRGCATGCDKASASASFPTWTISPYLDAPQSIFPFM